MAQKKAAGGGGGWGGPPIANIFITGSGFLKTSLHGVNKKKRFGGGGGAAPCLGRLASI